MFSEEVLKAAVQLYSQAAQIFPYLCVCLQPNSGMLNSFEIPTRHTQLSQLETFG